MMMSALIAILGLLIVVGYVSVQSLLVAALEAAGLTVRVGAWNDPTVDWAAGTLSVTFTTAGGFVLPSNVSIAVYQVTGATSFVPPIDPR